MSKLLDINNATKVFRLGGAIRGRKLTAIDEVNLSISDGQPSILSVVGESGCGKTTLCKMILRIHGIDSGDISLAGRSFAISDMLKGNLFKKSLLKHVWKAAVLFVALGVFSVFLLNNVAVYTQYTDIQSEIQVIKNLDQEIQALELRREQLELRAEEPGASARLRQQINEIGWQIGDLNRLHTNYLENDGSVYLDALGTTADSLRQDMTQSIIYTSIFMGVTLILTAFVYTLFVKKAYTEVSSLGMPKHTAVMKSLTPIAIVGLLAMAIGSFVSWNYTYHQVYDALNLVHNPEGLSSSASNEISWLNRILTNAEQSASFSLFERGLIVVLKLIVLLGLTALFSCIFAKKPEKRMDVYDFKKFRKDIQPIFQNPYETFSMRKRVDSYLYSTARKLGGARNRKETEKIVDDVLRSVGMSYDVIKGKYAAQFSGGELQRISIARALIPHPKLIVADEPVAAIDASMKMNIVNLFKELKDKYNVSFIYITHDLSTAYYVSDYIATLYRGSLIEYGTAKEVMDSPAHPYTQLLMNSIPRVGDKWDESAVMPDMEEKEYAIDYCKFAPRCPYATDECRNGKPKLITIGESRTVLCNFPLAGVTDAV